MATSKFYLDTRKAAKEATLKIVIRNKNTSSHLSIDVKLLPTQWDEKQNKIVNHPNKLFLNNFIARKMIDVNTELLQLPSTMSANEMRDAVIEKLNPKEEKDKRVYFAERFVKFANSHTNKRTKEIYLATLDRIKAFDKGCDSLTFEEITKDWLQRFDAFMTKTSPSQNARNIQLRNIRAVFNDAIDDEITTSYPFRKFKIKGVETVKRSLTVEKLRDLFFYNVETYQEKYLDMFKLIFYLIGINIKDLCYLIPSEDGRVSYSRAKTKKLYSIKLEPEAVEIIERYRGEKYLLNMLDRYDNYKDYAKRLNDTLQLIGEVKVGNNGKKTVIPAFPEITTYWARHSWATIAAELEIPKETIAAALGHGGRSTTDIYIDFDIRKVEEANRRVIDYILYDKR